MRSTRSLRASGGRTPGTTCCLSGQAKRLGGSAGGTCAGTVDEPPGRPLWSVVCSRLMVAIILACMARFCATAASSSAVAEAWTARDSESKKRLAGSRFCEPCVLVPGQES